MTEQNHPTITLAGVQYQVPPVPLIGMSEIVPAVLSLPKKERFSQDIILTMARIVYLGVKTQSPSLSFEEFQKLPVTHDDLVIAVPVVAMQAGMKLVQKDESPGEATAA